VLVGRDLRASSPAIAALCCAALIDAGLTPLDCGALPTPALAAHGLRHGLPAIMVTGSHIPEDRNGLKFYRAQGEIDKNDEVRILAHHAAFDRQDLPMGARTRQADAPETDLVAAYRARSLDFFGPGFLKGLTIGVYQHSSVARDVIVAVLEGLGARPCRSGARAASSRSIRRPCARRTRRWRGNGRASRPSTPSCPRTATPTGP
jgi:phosphomannomutase